MQGLIPKDVIDIVYRYIHRDVIGTLHTEYHSVAHIVGEYISVMSLPVNNRVLLTNGRYNFNNIFHLDIKNKRFIIVCPLPPNY